MSYSRFSDSDVYTFWSVDGHLECCSCSLLPFRGEHGFHESAQIKTATEFEAHLREHEATGHDVDVAGIMAHIRDDIARDDTDDGVTL